MSATDSRPPMSRRSMLALASGGVAAAVLTACEVRTGVLAVTASSGRGAVSPSAATGPASPPDPAATIAGPRIDLTAAAVTADLAGRTVSTWAYRAGLAGPEIRVRKGDTLAVTIANHLTAPTTVHWHGVALRNASDGVPDLTQPAIAPGGRYSTSFVVPDPGTYWYHSHVGVQLDRGLYGPLIVEDPDDPAVDLDQVIMLDDWLDGLGATPEQVLAVVGSADGMAGMANMAGMSEVAVGAAAGLVPPTPMLSAALGGQAGSIAYPMHLLNGRPPADRPTYRVARGGRVRLRLINAGSDTAYRFAVGGHQLTVTHADGWPIHPVPVSSLLIGMGERYDVTFVARSGVWPIYAAAEGKTGAAAAVLRTTDTIAGAPAPASVPAELSGALLSYGQLRPAEHTALADRRPDNEFQVVLSGRMSRPGRTGSWKLFGDVANGMRVRAGERVRITMLNRSPLFHPMHLHGHTFAVSGSGTRKDTVNVLPRQSISIDFDATNPGQWMYHCHNTYHSAMGMMTTLRYQ